MKTTWKEKCISALIKYIFNTCNASKQKAFHSSSSFSTTSINPSLTARRLIDKIMIQII